APVIEEPVAERAFWEQVEAGPVDPVLPLDEDELVAPRRRYALGVIAALAAGGAFAGAFVFVNTRVHRIGTTLAAPREAARRDANDRQAQGEAKLDQRLAAEKAKWKGEVKGDIDRELGHVTEHMDEQDKASERMRHDVRTQTKTINELGITVTSLAHE